MIPVLSHPASYSSTVDNSAKNREVESPGCGRFVEYAVRCTKNLRYLLLPACYYKDSYTAESNIYDITVFRLDAAI